MPGRTPRLVFKQVVYTSKNALPTRQEGMLPSTVDCLLVLEIVLHFGHHVEP